MVRHKQKYTIKTPQNVKIIRLIDV